MSQMIEMHSADHCVVVAELATSLKDVKFSKQRPDICRHGLRTPNEDINQRYTVV